MDIEINKDSSWRIKRRTNLNKETKNSKRRCPSSTPDQMEANKNIPTIPIKPKINLYLETHRGPAYIKLELILKKHKPST
ncbi:hypothetical protein K0M31_007150 [Melipona bicolor]|uniref:Uncharacterized protein n=1 Tax=Melipona bicolor TaxID=60889 RepID=A0AA40FSF8_9HYME|nr:hypothetical protein K0M31_007150 [Melipona bicolor]